MYYQILVSPQVKQSVIISNKHGIYELPRNLPNNLRFKILRNYSLVLSHPAKTKILSIVAKDSLKKEIELFP